MSRTTSRRAPLCLSCGKSTRHHSPKHCRPCAESAARFAEKFDGKGSGVKRTAKALRRQELRRIIADRADELPDYLLSLNNAMCELRDMSKGKRGENWAALYRRMRVAGDLFALCMDIEDQLVRDGARVTTKFFTAK